MHRVLAAAVLTGALLGTQAFAQEDSSESPEVCVLTATETITAPKKPNIFTMSLDCGSEPSRTQATAIVDIVQMDNAVDALQRLYGVGFELEGSTTMVSYTGNAIISTYVMVSEPEEEPKTVYMPMPADDAEMGEGEGEGDLDEMGEGESMDDESLDSLEDDVLGDIDE